MSRLRMCFSLIFSVLSFNCYNLSTSLGTYLPNSWWIRSNDPPPLVFVLKVRLHVTSAYVFLLPVLFLKMQMLSVNTITPIVL